MGARVYSGAATPTTITSSITNVSTSVTIASATNWLTSGQFSVVIDPGLSGEEKCLATLSGTTLTFVTRGYDNTTAASHNSGASIYPVPTAIDFSEANTHVNASSAVHGVAGTIVGTTDTQTLTNKTLTAPVITYSINAQVGTTYTTVLSDGAAIVTLTNASAIALTIPPNSSVAYAVGTQLNFAQYGAGQVTISGGSGVTIVSTGATAATPKLRAQYASASAIQTSANNWLVVGDIS